MQVTWVRRDAAGRLEERGVLPIWKAPDVVMWAGVEKVRLFYDTGATVEYTRQAEEDDDE